ncbi:MAG: NAD(P)H-hydrate dehydratase [Peptococcia bacterium]
MRVLTGKEMNKIDLWAQKEMGIPTLLLMENAGQAVANKAKSILGEAQDKMVILLAGKGNNGGDALVAARQLAQLGYEIKLFLLFPPEYFRGASLENWKYIERMDLKWHLLEDDNSFYLLKLSLGQCDLVIDGIFGTGFAGHPSEKIARAIDVVNDSQVPILAIDVPSGLNADNGQLAEPCICAKYTVTMAWLKRGLVVYPGKNMVGELEVADISLPPEGLSILENQEYYLTTELAKQLLPPVDPEGYKNSFGHILVIAGSAGMTGAAYLAARAAFRSGAGMVTVCLPESLRDTFDTAFPECLTVGLAETEEKTLSLDSWPQIEEQLTGKDVVVFGPGLGRREEIRYILAELLAKSNLPIVIDADGLYALAQEPEIIEGTQAPVILTPHPGEMSLLLNMATKAVQANRFECVKAAAERYGAIVVLKGAATITADPEGDLYLNGSGNPALATAGTGDVLAGTIGGLMGQGLNPLAATVLGVYLHGLAGDMLAAEKGNRGILASEVAEMLPYARNCLL